MDSSTTLVFNVPIKELANKCNHLFQLHWEELALNKDKIDLNYDVDKAVELETKNMLSTIMVVSGEKPIGYSVTVYNTHLHYKEDLYAFVDVIYLLPEYRGKLCGAKLLIETEKQAALRGASVILHHAKPYVPDIIRPLEKLNYQLYEHIYGKCLKD